MLTINFGDDAIQKLIASNQTNQQLVDEDGNPVIVAAPIPSESPENESTAEGEEFYIQIVPEGRLTDDKRYFEYGCFDVRETPIPLLYQPQTEAGHGQSVKVGAIDNVWRNGGFIVGTGRFFSEDREHVALAIEEIKGGVNRVSADLVATEYTAQWGVDEEGYEVLEQLNFTSAKVAGATIVAVSAFDDEARIFLGGAPDPVEGLVASGAYPTGYENAFLMPEHTEPMPLTLRELDNGIMQVFGYVALWDTCHIGKESCVTAPHSKTNYAHFQNGKHGETPVGVLTMDTGHAKIRNNMSNATAHYDNTGSVAAYVQCVENNFGIAFCGYIEPELDDSQLRRLSACGVSGDWRFSKEVNQLELMAVLAVPTAGFSTPRAFEESPGKQLSLVAAGSYCRPCEENAETLDDVIDAYFSNRENEIDQLLDEVK